jgi:hypothetical protein
MTLYPTEYAIKIANKGKPVFPCNPEDKSPLTKHGFKNATTNPGLVAALFNKHPDALIGMPTGRRSGTFVMDVDRLEALDELEPELRRELEQTLTVRTRSGGLHFYFEYEPGITNSAGTLPNGIDVRGEGGYVIAPYSRDYKIINHVKISPAPKALLDKLREKKKVCSATPNLGGAAKIDLDSIEPIPVGSRNNTFASIGGKLRSLGYERDDIEAALLRINAERCTQPLPEREVRAIAASVSRYRAGKAIGPPPHEALEMLDTVEAAMWEEDEDFKGNGGNSNWNHLVAALKVARKYGKLVEGGVEFYLGTRAWALAAGAGSTNTTLKVLKRLSNWLRLVEKGSGSKASKLLILKPDSPRAKVRHSNQGSYIEEKNDSSVSLSRAPFTAPRLRRSSPGYRPERGLIRGTRKVRVGPTAEPTPPQKRIGPGCNPVIDYLEKMGGCARLEEIAEAVGIRRTRDLTRRKTAHPKSRDGLVTRLENIGVVEVQGDTVHLVEEWLECLNAERKRAGELKDYERDMKKYNDQREGYRNRHKNKPEEHPANEPLPGDYFGGPVRVGKKAREAYQGERPLSPLAEAIKAYLDHNPHDACQLPGWLGTTLWAHNLYPDRPTPDASIDAIEELGGEMYLRERLEAKREGVA